MAIFVIQTHDDEAFIAYREDAAFEELKQYPDAHAVIRCEVQEDTCRDMSFELAEKWLSEICNSTDGFPASQSEFPAFIQRYISPLRLEELMSDQEAEARYETNHIRSYAGAL